MTAAEYFREMPVIRTPRLILRKLSMEDAEQMFAYASDPQMTRFTTWDTHRSIDDTLAFLAEAERRYEDGKPIAYGVVHTASKRLIGTCGLAGWNDQHERGALG